MTLLHQKQNNQFNTKPVYIKCKMCKKKVRISPSRLGDKKYCGIDCYNKSKEGKPFTKIIHGMANKHPLYSVWKGNLLLKITVVEV